MADKTKIEWTHSTWNPVTGCTPISEGCRNCYAARYAKRKIGDFKNREFSEVFSHQERLKKPRSWIKPRMVFVSSMGDLFHRNVSNSFIAEVWQKIYISPKHTFNCGVLDNAGKQGLEGCEWAEPFGKRYGEETYGSTCEPSRIQLPQFPPGPSDREAWSRILETRPDLAPAVADAKNGKTRQTGITSRFGYASTNEAQPKICGVADGVSHRVDRLRCLGNAVVPQTAKKAFLTLWNKMMNPALPSAGAMVKS